MQQMLSVYAYEAAYSTSKHLADALESRLLQR